MFQSLCFDTTHVAQDSRVSRDGKSGQADIAQGSNQRCPPAALLQPHRCARAHFLYVYFAGELCAALRIRKTFQYCVTYSPLPANSSAKKHGALPVQRRHTYGCASLEHRSRVFLWLGERERECALLPDQQRNVLHCQLILHFFGHTLCHSFIQPFLVDCANC